MSSFVQDLYNSYGQDVILKPYWGGSLPDFPLSDPHAIDDDPTADVDPPSIVEYINDSDNNDEDSDNSAEDSDNSAEDSDNSAEDSDNSESGIITIEPILENINPSKNVIDGGGIFFEDVKEKIVDYGSDIATSTKHHVKHKAKQSITNYMNAIQ